MINVVPKIEGIQKAAMQMNLLNEAGKDVSQIWVEFLEIFKQYVGDTWQRQGRNWGSKWKGYGVKGSEYRKKYEAFKKARTGTRAVNLTLTGRLKRAATGQSNEYFQRIQNTSASWGIRGIPYAAIHQFGGQAGRNGSATIPARPYFAHDVEGLPGELLQKLFDITNKHFMENV